ncbi:hypothetical protein [Desulfoluna spongiiphila]|uniref:Protein kinase domain-containing protein n=1 Tax=Desulfoluna spongiiphila TaxID=419481 RepID=A0A1G5DMA2_9BACT|nr:hypothetical protein [Desulfoluna spongiiphila]SCY15796.1 Protein kinase domain-containing protein [Desulfoluna spongiiphila]
MKAFKRILFLFVLFALAVSFFPEKTDLLWRRADHWIRAVAESLTFFILFIYNDAPVTEEGVAFFLVAAVVFLSLWGVFSFKAKAGKEGRGAGSTGKAPESSHDEAAEIEYRYVEEDVVKHFLGIYRTQLGVRSDAPCRFEPVEGQRGTFGVIYELGVLKGGEWQTRRLTIGPLGEAGTQRSHTWFVIYDRYIVVKIPPKPLTDFNAYIKELVYGNSLAARLAPTECVVPNVTVIMELLAPNRTPSLSATEIEKGHVGRLSTNAAYQKHLMIGPSFAFFMDLSRYYFLSQVLEDIHISRKSIEEEIVGHPHILWDLNDFEGRYGKERAASAGKISAVFDFFEEEVNRLLVQFGISSSLPIFSVRSWFVQYLAGRTIPTTDQNLSAAFMDELNTQATLSMAEHAEAIAAYRQMIHDYLFKKNTVKTRAMIGSIVTNLLDLLAGLNKRYIAIRDIKPDNLLIAGDPENYPSFLTSPTEFKVGIIDVETAAYLSMGEKGRIEQPLLGGTPKYATPSNLFGNEVIREHFGEVARILRLQDWYATAALIFKVVTGKDLFEDSAQLIPEVLRILSVADDDSGPSVYEYVSRIYFKKALAEFDEKITKHREMLSAFQIIVLRKNQKVLKTEIDFCKMGLEARVDQLVEAQTFFQGEKNTDTLKRASSQQILRLIDTWKKKSITSDQQRSRVAEAVRFLRLLHGFKVQFEGIARFSARFNEGGMKVSAHHLIHAMFQTVCYSMYTRVWGELSGAEGFEATQEVADETLERTLDCEKTVSVAY